MYAPMNAPTSASTSASTRAPTRAPTRAALARAALARAALALLLAACWGGCTNDGMSRPDGSPVARNFHAPQGVAAARDYILVANTGLEISSSGTARYQPGFVTLIDRASRRVVGRVPTTQYNPVWIEVRGQTAYVLNAGRSRQAGGLATAESPGGIDVLDLSGGVPAAVSRNIELALDPDDPRVGLFGSLVIRPDETQALVGSGTRGDVFRVDVGDDAAESVLPDDRRLVAGGVGLGPAPAIDERLGLRAGQGGVY